MTSQTSDVAKSDFHPGLDTHRAFPSLFHVLPLTGLSKTGPVPVYRLQGQSLQLLAPEKGRFRQQGSGPQQRGEVRQSERGPSAWPGSQLRHLAGAPHPSVKWARQGPPLRAFGRPWRLLSLPAVWEKRGNVRWSFGVRAHLCACCVPHILQTRSCRSIGVNKSSSSYRGGQVSRVGTTVCGSW